MNRMERIAERVVASKPRRAGTWALPGDPNAARQLGNIVRTMKQGQSPQDRNDVTDILYPLLGDDSLFDDIARLSKEYHKRCAAAVVKRIKELAAQDPSDFKDQRDHASLVALSKSL